MVSPRDMGNSLHSNSPCLPIPAIQKVVFVISSLQSGGAERVVSTLVNSWVNQERKVALVTIDDAATDFYRIDERVERASLGITGTSRDWLEKIVGNARRIAVLRRKIRRTGAAVAVSFGVSTNVITVITCLALRIPVIVSERSDPRQHDVGRMWSLLRRVTYPLAHRVVVQTDGVATWFAQHIPRARVSVIPNPIPAELSARCVPPLPQGPDRRLVAMGRMSDEKQFDLLIRCFAALASDFPEWKLWIWGDGPLRLALETQINELGLSGRVVLPGRTKQPWDELAKADLFVLTSRFEGFPNVMLEAMALGRPCVAFDCQSGPRELSNNGKDALLVPVNDSVELIRALKQLMGSDRQRKLSAARAVAVRNRYQLEDIFECWAQIVTSAPVAAGACFRHF